MTEMRRVQVTFWLLVTAAVVAAGVLMRAVEWSADPTTGATVAAAGMATVIAVALAARILIVLGRSQHRRKPNPWPKEDQPS